MDGRLWEAALFLPSKAGITGVAVSLDAPLPSFTPGVELRGRIGLWPDPRFGSPVPYPLGGLELDATYWATPTLGLTARVGAKLEGLWNGATLQQANYAQFGVELRP